MKSSVVTLPLRFSAYQRRRIVKNVRSPTRGERGDQQSEGGEHPGQRGSRLQLPHVSLCFRKGTVLARFWLSMASGTAAKVACPGP